MDIPCKADERRSLSMRGPWRAENFSAHAAEFVQDTVFPLHHYCEHLRLPQDCQLDGGLPADVRNS